MHHAGLASAFIRSSPEPLTNLGFAISGVGAGSKGTENVELVQLGKKHRIRHPFAGFSLVLKGFNKRKVGG